MTKVKIWRSSANLVDSEALCVGIERIECGEAVKHSCFLSKSSLTWENRCSGDASELSFPQGDGVFSMIESIAVTLATSRSQMIDQWRLEYRTSLHGARIDSHVKPNGPMFAHLYRPRRRSL